MFGKPSQQGPTGRPTPPRSAAADAARIQGGGLVQCVVTGVEPLNYYLFLNTRAVPQTDVESLSVFIETPEAGDQGTVRATLAVYMNTVSGERTQQRIELFPSTLEIVALGRRLSITCMNADSFDGLWITLGLKPDGTGAEVTGVKALRILITEGILDAKLTWMDGEVEDLLSPM